MTTFHEASRLTCATPTTTEEAQYSLPFAVAAALVRGRVGAEEVGADGIADPDIRRLGRATAIERSGDYDARFPAERWAHVVFGLTGGREVRSKPATARGGPDDPLTEPELLAKYRALSQPVFGRAVGARIEAALRTLGAAEGDEPELFDALARHPGGCPPRTGAPRR